MKKVLPLADGCWVTHLKEGAWASWLDLCALACDSGEDLSVRRFIETNDGGRGLRTRPLGRA
jgi:hypothetical protein